MQISTLKNATCMLMILIFQILSSAQENRLFILDKFVEKRTQFQSVSYSIVLEMKIFSTEDTLVRNASVEIVRNSHDSLYGGYFGITIQDSIRFSYDGQKIRKAQLDSAVVTIGDPHANPGLWVQSTWVDNFLDYGFIKMTQGPKAMMQDSTVKTTFCDTMIGSWPCIGIFIRFPDEGEFEKRTFFTAIDTVEYMARSRMYSVLFQENEQYTNWLYENIKYSNDTIIENLDNSFVLSYQETGQNHEDATSATVQPEFNYVNLSGKIFAKNEVFNLLEVKEKIIILDFWYTSCYPCIKGIPSVNRLYRDYKDKGVAVYGVNMIDDEVKSKARLEKFFKNNLMEYPAIMVDPAMANEIGIRAFPTLLVLDKDYQIIYMEDGFSDQLYEKVAAFLDTRL